MITLRFVTVPGLVSDLIARGQLGVTFPTHVEAVMPDGTLLGAHLKDGVQARPSDYDALHWQTEHYASLLCSDDQAYSFHTVLRAQVGKPYDTAGIAAMAAGSLLGWARDWRSTDSWFCSELQAWALEQSDIIGPLPLGANHITPLMLYVACAAASSDFGHAQTRSLATATVVVSPPAVAAPLQSNGPMTG